MNKLLLSVASLLAMCNIYATQVQISNSGTTFTPNLITITFGDTVVFQLDGSHNAQEVDVNTYNANGNSPIIGFQTNFGGGQVTGLTVGTHYYVCSPHASMGMKGRIVVQAPPTIIVPNVWLNEIHYDNSGGDVNEGFEIAGPSGTDLSCYKVYLYNGSNGQVYDSLTLSGFLPFQACQFGTKWFDIPGSGVLQNGNPDGIGLVYAPQLTGCGMGGVDTTLQFLSYGGTFAATNGRLRFQTSQDIGVTEGSSTLTTESMQLTGRGNAYSSFTWVADTASTHDNVNVGQNFCGLQHFTLLPATASVNEGAGSITIPVLLDSASQLGTQVTLALVTGFGTATQGVDYTFNNVVLTWPAGTTGYVQATVPILNDSQFELNETFKLVLRNPTNGASLTADSTQVITIIDNDPLSGADCSDLFFSEYVEGSGNNKALEIYNPTANAINLADYSILKTTNGGASTSYSLTGSIAAGDVHVLANPAANGAILAQADATNSFFDFDGNDGLALLHLNDTIDVIGDLGVTVNGGFPVGNGSTQNNTLIRNYYQYKGSDVWLVAAAQYNVYASDMTDSLGMHHTAPCGSLPPPPPAFLSFDKIIDTVAESDTVIHIAVRFVNPSNIQYTYTIGYDAALSTATNNVDVTYTNIVKTHGQGTFVDTITTMNVHDDALIEPTEIVRLSFFNVPANVYPTADSVYNLYITDTDKLNVSFLGAGLSFSENVGLAQVKLVISTPADSTTTVNVSLATGNAILGTDFLFNDTTIIFPANSGDTQSVWVTIIDDNIDEGNEQANFNLTNATNGANILVSAFTLTIIDNDSTIIGISDINAEDGIRVYPNPAVNTLTVQSQNALKQIVITDLIGNVVLHSSELAAGKNRLDITTLPAGMYVVSIKGDGKTISRKFVKTE